MSAWFCAVVVIQQSVFFNKATFCLRFLYLFLKVQSFSLVVKVGAFWKRYLLGLVWPQSRRSDDHMKDFYRRCDNHEYGFLAKSYRRSDDHNMDFLEKVTDDLTITVPNFVPESCQNWNPGGDTPTEKAMVGKKRGQPLTRWPKKVRIHAAGEFSA